MLGTAVLDIELSADAHPGHRIRVSGELDAETAPRLLSGLRATAAADRTIRLDLSGIEFIDCTGLTALIGALEEARSAGRTVEVDRKISAPVRRIVQLTHTGEQIWP